MLVLLSNLKVQKLWPWCVVNALVRCGGRHGQETRSGWQQPVAPECIEPLEDVSKDPLK